MPDLIRCQENGLAYITINEGECGAYVAQPGDEVYITHAGLTEQGRQFDGNVQDELFKGDSDVCMVLSFPLCCI